jgi:sec-independent protein translocase protein TatC
METSDTLHAFLGHVTELLSRLKVAVAAVFVSTILVLVVPIDAAGLDAAWSNPNYNTIASIFINRLRVDLLPNGVELLPLDWFAPFTIYVYSAVFLGVTISSPIIIYEIYKFINPALYDNERKLVYLFVGSFTVLFLFGVALGYFMLVPVTFKMLMGMTTLLGLSPRYEFSSFFGVVLGGTLMTGLFFTFPVFFLTLVWAGVLKTSMVTGARKIIYIGVFVLICIITPDPTILSDIIIFFPVVVLLEGSLLIGKYIENKREKANVVPQEAPVPRIPR